MKEVPYDFYWGVCERGVANNDTLEQMFTTRDKAVTPAGERWE